MLQFHWLINSGWLDRLLFIGKSFVIHWSTVNETSQIDSDVSYALLSFQSNQSGCSTVYQLVKSLMIDSSRVVDYAVISILLNFIQLV